MNWSTCSDPTESGKLAFIPRHMLSAVDPRTGAIIVKTGGEPSQSNAQHNELFYQISLAEKYARFVIFGYGIDGKQLYLSIKNYSGFGHTLKFVFEIIEQEGRKPSTYDALQYLASGIVCASGDYKGYKVSGCVDLAAWPVLVNELPPDAARNANGEVILYTAEFGRRR